MPVGIAVLGAVIAVLIGYPFVHHVVTERNRLTRQVANLENGFNEEQARAAALQDKLDARDREIAAADLQQQRNDLWRASQEQAAKQAAVRLSRLNDELEAAQGSGKQVRQANAKLQQRLDEQQTQLAAGKKQLSERDAALVRAQEQQQKLEAQLAADYQSGQQRTARIAELTDALRQARDQQQELQTKMKAADVAQRAAETRVADLEKKFASTQHASTVPAVLAPATGGNEPLQRRLAELQAQLSRYTAQRPVAEHSAAHDSDDLAAARQRAARLTAAYKAQLENATKLKHVDADTLNQLAAARNALEKAQAEIARIEGARGIYTVQGGDSLSLIAAFFYHNGNRWPQIFKSNAFLVNNPDLIFPGMVLIVPE
ncbi:MAG TPA: LysM peptidoglycan-binding domain-containing protein [Burkholderiales bacterium]|nr:LysM peptidoglycan-binding domain-containing protein [Burkholderiales bacterium]